MGNLLRHGVHDGLRGHDGACNCSFGVDGLAGRIRTIHTPNRSRGSSLPMTSWRVSRDFVCEFLTQDTRLASFIETRIMD